ncbi:MAG TPA: ATP synthase F1 subunit epsilon [bacterium]|nr:ATP synthase F1 subunit epsilon [bacterium]
MSKFITVAIVTPEDVMFKGEAVSVIIPAADGYMEFLQQHAPLVTPLGTGVLTVTRVNGQRRYFYIEGGYAEIHTNRLTVLADDARVLHESDDMSSLPTSFAMGGDMDTEAGMRNLLEG